MDLLTEVGARSPPRDYKHGPPDGGRAPLRRVTINMDLQHSYTIWSSKLEKQSGQISLTGQFDLPNKFYPTITLLNLGFIVLIS